MMSAICVLGEEPSMWGRACEQEVEESTEPAPTMRIKGAYVARGDRTFLITGGLGGFGLALAVWLVEHGARKIVLSSKRCAPQGPPFFSSHSSYSMFTACTMLQGVPSCCLHANFIRRTLTGKDYQDGHMCSDCHNQHHGRLPARLVLVV